VPRQPHSVRQLEYAAEWSGRDQLQFLENLGIDWNKRLVPLSQLEQLDLTTYEVIHKRGRSVRREGNKNTPNDSPIGLFADVRVDQSRNCTRESRQGTLPSPIELIRKFCA
jgi:hypothetical protein